jgi:hypothetical protein
MAAPPVVKIIPERSVFLLCDLQTRFSMSFGLDNSRREICSRWVQQLGPAVHHFDKIVMTVNKMVQIAKVCLGADLLSNMYSYNYVIGSGCTPHRHRAEFEGSVFYLQ